MRLLLFDINRAFLFLLILVRRWLTIRWYSFTTCEVIVNSLFIFIRINCILYFLFAMPVHLGLRSSNHIISNISLCLSIQRVGPEIEALDLNIIQIRWFRATLNQGGYDLLLKVWGGSIGLCICAVVWRYHSKWLAFEGIKIGTIGFVIVIVIEIAAADLKARLG